MSKTRHEEAKWGELYPRFTPNIDELNNALELGRPGMSLSQGALQTIGDKALGKVKLVQVQTSDGYNWWWGISLSIYFLPVTIVLPRAMDESRQEGTSNDRSCAIYTSASIPTDQLEVIIKKLAEAIREFKAESAAVS